METITLNGYQFLALVGICVIFTGTTLAWCEWRGTKVLRERLALAEKALASDKVWIDKLQRDKATLEEMLVLAAEELAERRKQINAALEKLKEVKA